MNLSTVNSTLTGTSSPTIISGDDLGNYVTFLVLYSNGKTHVPCGMMQQVIINSLLLGWAHKKYLKKKIIRHFLEKRASQTYTNCFPKYGQVSAKKKAFCTVMASLIISRNFASIKMMRSSTLIFTKCLF